MERDSLLQIDYFKSLPSTQLYLKERIQKDRDIRLPLAIVADIQTAGIGSRENSWTSQEGNLFLSFALSLDDLPSDLKLESASIYFAYILKETLSDLGSSLFVKWPNDLYIGESKIGGVITTLSERTLICGIGLNLDGVEDSFASLDIKIERELLLKNYFQNIKKRSLWKQVFSKYKLDFHNNQEFFTHINAKRVSLREVQLEDDGSLNINGERIYSLR